MWLVLAALFAIITVAAFVVKRRSPNNIPSFAPTIAIVATLIFTGLGTFNQMFFYAQPGNIYHVRTILGSESVVDGVGYKLKLFGFVNTWKKEMTVQNISVSSFQSSEDDVNSESERSTASANLKPQNIMFLDRVDASALGTARFRLPTDEDGFLRMAHAYRTPDNLLRTALVPAYKETFNATASLMTAEKYYSGGRTEFNLEFQNQMQDGVYIVDIITEKEEDNTAQGKGSANASKGEEQANYGENKRLENSVVKRTVNGVPLRKTQNFADYGITVVEARITDMHPNDAFLERMKLQQDSSAANALAKQERVKEENQKLLAVTRGEREVAQQQAKSLVVQMRITTDAETQKQLAITEANKKLDSAKIDKQTAEIQLEQAKIDANKIRELADAAAYEKRVIIEADNALEAKLATEVKIQASWAEAFALRNVPTTVFGGSSGTPTGSDSAASNFMSLMTMQAAERLNYDRSVNTTK